MTDWQQMTGALGGECRGLDLMDVDPAALYSDLRRFKLLVIRDQRLDPGMLTEFARRLGELDVYPFAEPLPGFPHVVGVVKEAEDESNFGGAWHTDTAYMVRPPALTLLYAVEVPDTGGDTLFADMVGAYEGLSEGFRAACSTLVGHNTASLVHDASGGYASVTGQSVALKDAAVSTQADHPLVIEHSGSGRRALFFSLIHTSHFLSMSRAESLPLLNQLHDLATAPANVTRLHWEPGTLAIWDNRAVQHYPLNDYPGQRREMHRIIVKGDRPRGTAI